MTATSEQTVLLNLFNNMLTNEIAKALVAVSSFNQGSHWNAYGGTSYSTVVASHPSASPGIAPGSGLDGLASAIAEAWVESSRAVANEAQRILAHDEIELLETYGVFYGVEVSPKAIAVAVSSYATVEELQRLRVPDLYRFPEYTPAEQEEIVARIASLVETPICPKCLALADSCHADNMGGACYIFPPANMNEILSEVGQAARRKIKEECDDRAFVGSGPLLLLSGDTDNPYRCGAPLAHAYGQGVPFTPGLTLVGATGTTEAMNVLTLFRLGMVAQLVRGNVLHSKLTGRYRPFTMFGMGTPRDIASGFLDIAALSQLRYPGLIDMETEFDCQRKWLKRLAFSE